eukprot:364375-Chlamydomonas_euryale.AAC.2
MHSAPHADGHGTDLPACLQRPSSIAYLVWWQCKCTRVLLGDHARMRSCDTCVDRRLAGTS